MAVRDVRFTIRARDATQRAWRGVQGGLVRTGRIVRRVSGSVLRLATAFTGLGALTIGGLARFSGQLGTLADRAGVTDEELQGLRNAAQELGIDFNSLVSVLQRTSTIRGRALAGVAGDIERLQQAGIGDLAASDLSPLQFFFEVLRRGSERSGPALNQFLERVAEVEGVTVGRPIIANLQQFFRAFEQGQRNAFDIGPAERLRQRLIDLQQEAERLFVGKIANPLIRLVEQILPALPRIFDGIASAVERIAAAVEFLRPLLAQTRTRGLQGQRASRAEIAAAGGQGLQQQRRQQQALQRAVERIPREWGRLR